MSELLRSLAAYFRETPNPEVHVVTGQALVEDEPVQLAAAQPELRHADLEGRSIDAVNVGAPEHGRFTCFMDGMERQRVVLYCSMIPVVYGYVSAVIRERGADRRMRTRQGCAYTREALYYARRYADLGDVGSAGVDVIDIEGDTNRIEEHPMMLLEAAKKKVSSVRDALERHLTSEWLSANAGGVEWLLVDGSLTGNYDSHDSPNIVGVIKSHQTQYLPMEDQRKVLALKSGERSGVFIPKGRKRPDVYSWYIRLRPNDGQDVHFGLIRVEAAKCGRTLEMADEISRWLLAERSPLSLPDYRWDRMIYPIRDCELYLKSLAPSKTVLEASMFGLSASAR